MTLVYFLFVVDKCPATGIFASQIHSSPVVNHLLLGKKAIAAQHPCSNGVAQGPRGPAGPLPQAQSTPTLDHSLQSPWRAHVCAHRRNLARARAQLGFDDSIELEQNTSPEHNTEREEGEEKVTVEEDQEIERKENRESQKKVDEPLQEPVQGIMVEGNAELRPQDTACNEEIKEMEQQLSNLDLDASAQAPSELNDPGTPLPHPEPELGNNPQPQPEPNAQPYVSADTCSTCSNSSSSGSTACSFRQSSSIASTPEILPKPQQIFSPFPCIKVPRKSMAARNLGLYGPTSRTPNVHFPHMSKTMNRMGVGVAASTRRR